LIPNIRSRSSKPKLWLHKPTLNTTVPNRTFHFIEQRLLYSNRGSHASHDGLHNQVPRANARRDSDSVFRWLPQQRKPCWVCVVECARRDCVGSYNPRFIWLTARQGRRANPSTRVWVLGDLPFSGMS
jgi:hypothetical protein